MSDKIKIALADDEELFRKGIYFLLQREANFEVIFEAANGNQLIDSILCVKVKEVKDIFVKSLRKFNK